MPDFLLCNSKLTFQMTMTPEKTNYITQGADGVKRLRQGPDLTSYRGLSVIHSRSFAMEAGQHPEMCCEGGFARRNITESFPTHGTPIVNSSFTMRSVITGSLSRLQTS